MEIMRDVLQLIAGWAPTSPRLINEFEVDVTDDERPARTTSLYEMLMLIYMRALVNWSYLFKKALTCTCDV